MGTAALRGNLKPPYGARWEANGLLPTHAMVVFRGLFYFFLCGIFADCCVLRTWLGFRQVHVARSSRHLLLGCMLFAPIHGGVLASGEKSDTTPVTTFNKNRHVGSFTWDHRLLLHTSILLESIVFYFSQRGTNRHIRDSGRKIR
ncbi:unnamed protein product, partial [Ectocarpus sp. 8 AP-2014]